MVLTSDEAATMPGDADLLLIGIASDDAHRALLAWHAATPYLHEFLPDYHRLQLEHWIWTFKDQLDGKRILDIGAQNPRRWLGGGYRTLGNTEDVEADIQCDLLDLPYIHDWDAIICTEVLEHCADPFKAVAEMHLALRPGGLLLVTSPFIWPDHRTDDYPDYWRFCEQGWHLLMQNFENVTVKPVAWTSEAMALLDLVRRFEGWGWRHYIKGHTAYLVEAHKASNDRQG